jgi:hypothetical protein
MRSLSAGDTLNDHLWSLSIVPSSVKVNSLRFLLMNELSLEDSGNDTCHNSPRSAAVTLEATPECLSGRYEGDRGEGRESQVGGDRVTDGARERRMGREEHEVKERRRGL